MTTAIRTALTASGVFALAACSVPMRAGADFDPAVELGGALTFAWDEPDPLPTGDARLDANPLFEGRVHTAVERELGARGIRLVEASPRLVVHHHFSVRDRVEVLESDRAAGYATNEYGQGTQVLQYEEGTLLVDIADAATKKVIWRGWLVADVEGALEDPEELTGLVDRGVARMFELFPVTANGR